MPPPLRKLVESSDVPLWVVELPSTLVLAANKATSSLLGIPLDDFIGARATDKIDQAQRRASAKAVHSLLAGELTGYQVRRTFRPRAGEAREVSIWFCPVPADGGYLGLASAGPAWGGGPWPSPGVATLGQPGPGHIVLATLDNEWRIDRVTREVTDILGYEPTDVVGTPILGLVHPVDVPTLFSAISNARTGKHTVGTTLRVRDKPGNWAHLTAVLAALSDDYPPALAVALVPPVASGPARSEKTRRGRFEAEVGLLAHELRVAGMVPRLGGLPEPAGFPALSTLSAREWEVLVLILEGHRVPSIAADLYLSQSAVRNRLSSIFRKFGVHSQAELVRLLRST